MSHQHQQVAVKHSDDINTLLKYIGEEKWDCGSCRVTIYFSRYTDQQNTTIILANLIVLPSYTHIHMQLHTQIQKMSENKFPAQSDSLFIYLLAQITSGDCTSLISLELFTHIPLFSRRPWAHILRQYLKDSELTRGLRNVEPSCSGFGLANTGSS